MWHYSITCIRFRTHFKVVLALFGRKICKMPSFLNILAWSLDQLQYHDPLWHIVVLYIIWAAKRLSHYQALSTALQNSINSNSCINSKRRNKKKSHEKEEKSWPDEQIVVFDAMWASPFYLTDLQGNLSDQEEVPNLVLLLQLTHHHHPYKHGMHVFVETHCNISRAPIGLLPFSKFHTL